MSYFDDCMICGSRDFEVMKASHWMITGIGDVPVSFGLCRDCGHIAQNPCPSGDVIEAFYSEMSNYVNPDADWVPPAVPEVATTVRLVETARRHKPAHGTLYEVGCGNGRDLHYLKQDGWAVAGCEPSGPAGGQAAALTGAEIDIGFADDCLKGDRMFDAVVLSHVLEHVPDPRAMVELIHKHLKDNGLFLLEVPCARQPHLMCVGWLSIEHLSYFTTELLMRLLEECRFVPMEIILDDVSNSYPTITVACRKAQDADTRDQHYPNQSGANRLMLADHLARDAAHWQAVEARFAHVSSAYIYAAGVHTAQLLSETGLRETVDILGITDSSPLKAGKRQGDHTILSKEAFLDRYDGEHVIISSFNSERAIAAMLREEGISEDRIVRLYT